MKEGLNMATENKGYSWSVRSLSEREKKMRNSQSWPFKVVKEGDREFNCITSITELERSFNNTRFNNKATEDSMIANGRYNRILKSLKDKLSDKTQNIHYLYVSYDSIYYMTEDGNVGELSYGKKLSNDLDNIAYNALFNSNIVRRAISEYKGSMDSYLLSSLVELYIESRTQMKILKDSKKCIVDIFNSNSNSGVSFINVEYIIFSRTPQNAVDYLEYTSNFIKETIQKYNLPYDENVEKELSRYISIKEEERKFVELKNLIDSGSKIDGLGKLKKIVLTDKTFTPENIKRAFVSLKSREIQESIEEKQNKLNEVLDRSKDKVLNIYAMIYIMNRIVEINDGINVEGRSIGFEYPVWIQGNYSLNAVKTRLNLLYQIENLKETDIPILGVLSQVFERFLQKDKTEIDLELQYLDKYLPNNFKNDKHTFKSIGCSFETDEGVKKVVSVVDDIEKKFFYLFESMLGLQYAMFGLYMGRYGSANAWVAKKKVKVLDELYTPNHPFCLSSNVMEKANKAFYMIKCPDKIAEGQISVEDMAVNMGDWQYFVKYYLDLLTSDVTINLSEEAKVFNEDSEKYVKVLKYSDKEPNKQTIARVEGLMRITFCVIDILEECYRIVRVSGVPAILDLRSFVEEYRQLNEDRLNAIK